jgi:hypothetical protein
MDGVDGVEWKDARFMRLWDAYSPLLTPHQREVTDLYFNYDLSLSEIAEQKGVTRQSVSDCLVKCRARLEEYEKKLNFLAATDNATLEFSLYQTRVENWLAKQRALHPEREGELAELEEELAQEKQEM